jgi:hypothetical protein
VLDFDKLDTYHEFASVFLGKNFFSFILLILQGQFSAGSVKFSAPFIGVLVPAWFIWLILECQYRLTLS